MFRSEGRILLLDLALKFTADKLQLVLSEVPHLARHIQPDVAR